MTPGERADLVHDYSVYPTEGVLIAKRSDIADAIRKAVAEERRRWAEEWREEMRGADPAWHGFRVLRAMEGETR